MSLLSLIFLVDVELLGDRFNLFDSDFASLVKSIRNFQRMDTLVKQFLGLVENGSSEDHNTSGTITNLIVLTGGQFSKKFGSLMMNLLSLKDG